MGTRLTEKEADEERERIQKEAGSAEMKERIRKIKAASEREAYNAEMREEIRKCFEAAREREAYEADPKNYPGIDNRYKYEYDARSDARRQRGEEDAQARVRAKDRERAEEFRESQWRRRGGTGGGSGAWLHGVTYKQADMSALLGRLDEMGRLSAGNCVNCGEAPTRA
jgi:hypothetical protein